MIGLNEYKSILTNLNDPEVDISEALKYVMEHQYIDEDFDIAFGGLRQGQMARAYKYVLLNFISLNRQIGYRLSTEEYLSLVPFIFNEEYVATKSEYIDFIDFLRYYTKIFPMGPNRRSYSLADILPMDLGPLYHKLANLNQIIGLDIHTIINYCYEQTSTEASGDLFDLWYSFVADMPHEQGDSLTPQNLLFAINMAAIKNSETPMLFKLSKYSGNQLMFRKNKNTLIIRAALPVNPDTNEVCYEWIKLWFDHVGNIEVKSLSEHRKDNGVSFGNLFYEITIELTPNSLVMVDDDDINVTPRLPNQVRQHLFSGTDWVCFYEGPSRVTINRSRLVELRKARGFTQKEAAKAINASPRTFQYWEAKGNKAKPDMDSLIRLMLLYGVTDVKALIEVKKFFDVGDEKFRSGAKLEEMFPLYYDGELEPMEGLLAVLEEYQDDKKGGD